MKPRCGALVNGWSFCPPELWTIRLIYRLCPIC